jgi:hypothetical protein
LHKVQSIFKKAAIIGMAVLLMATSVGFAKITVICKAMDRISMSCCMYEAASCCEPSQSNDSDCCTLELKVLQADYQAIDGQVLKIFPAEYSIQTIFRTGLQANFSKLAPPAWSSPPNPPPQPFHLLYSSLLI